MNDDDFEIVRGIINELQDTIEIQFDGNLNIKPK